ncbi:MAG: acylphosphatase [Rhodocyclales bacterium]|nr:acylphosphatase [Rhodocyclales bacterium]
MTEPAESDSVDDRVGRHLLIRGLVQGVGFRWSMVEMARRLGLCGWVRNRRDGSVEAVVSGPNAEVAAMIHWAGQGPAGSRVEGVEVEEWPQTFEEFAQVPTI